MCVSSVCMRFFVCCVFCGNFFEIFVPLLSQCLLRSREAKGAKPKESQKRRRPRNAFLREIKITKSRGEKILRIRVWKVFLTLSLSFERKKYFPKKYALARTSQNHYHRIRRLLLLKR